MVYHIQTNYSEYGPGRPAPVRWSLLVTQPVHKNTPKSYNQHNVFKLDQY